MCVLYALTHLGRTSTDPTSGLTQCWFAGFYIVTLSSIFFASIVATLKSGDAVKLRYHMKMRLNNSSLISVNSDKNHLRLTQMIN